jgi:hypothetical protein
MVLGGEPHAPAALPPVLNLYPLYSRQFGPQAWSWPARNISRLPHNKSVAQSKIDLALSQSSAAVWDLRSYGTLGVLDRLSPTDVSRQSVGPFSREPDPWRWDQ